MQTRRSHDYETPPHRRGDDTDPTETSSSALEERWSGIKTRFVDDPTGALDEAVGMIEESLDDLVHEVRSRCGRLRDGDGGDRGRDTTTEELRRRLHECRSVLDQLRGHPLH